LYPCGEAAFVVLALYQIRDTEGHPSTQPTV